MPTSLIESINAPESDVLAARACAELCGADAARLDGRCLAFSVELLRARGKADVCRLKSEARLLAESEKYLYWKQDSHWTAEGNHLTGLILAEHIKKHAARFSLSSDRTNNE